MEEVCIHSPNSFQALSWSQDRIGWRKFMDGMISKEIIIIQQSYQVTCGSRQSLDKWAKGLVTKLLEVTHTQWLYRNVMVHDRVTGAHATLRKEDIQLEIERQQALGSEDLLGDDKYLMEINLEDLATSSGERQEYWLLAIRAARLACMLRDQNNTHSTVVNT